ncbi:MAG: phage holin family protein [Cyanobacteria bacterium SZAS LIN-3]|nr:phage holin family protein [Cyanobacteria bacterium SZAS LIN-3]MBS2005942.1 phage holin family protein [Cyanobacteria bacterium SZAS TMP-1]
MMLTFLIQVLLLLAALLYLVPAVTDSGVAIRQNSAFRGVLALVVIALINKIFWHVLAIAGVGASIPVALFTAGVVGWLANSLAIFTTGRLMPGVLYVRSFTAAMGASLVLMIAGWVISLFLL